jgi:hypothetical protein
VSKAGDINRQDCLQHLEKIEASKEFASARLDKKLLRYLVESTLDGQPVKETTIAIEVFDKDSSFNPGEDSSVRSHIYTIRKKLDSYYTNEGSSDQIRFVIPKGQYRVMFRKHIKRRLLFKQWPKAQVGLAFAVLVLLIVCLTLFSRIIELKQATAPKRANPIFKDFAESDLPTLIAVGDFYFYKQINFEYSDISRIACINSDADLDNYLSEHPEASQFMARDDNSYVGPNVIYELPLILSELQLGYQDVKINLASNVTYEDVRENNIIYLGSLKSLGILRNVMNVLHLQFALCPHRIFLTSAQGDTTHVYMTSLDEPQDFKFTDYAIVAKFPGPNNNHILIISAFHAWDTGTTVKSLKDEQFLNNISNQFSILEPFPSHFEALFRLTGFRRTSLDAEVLHFIER